MLTLVLVVVASMALSDVPDSLSTALGLHTEREPKDTDGDGLSDDFERSGWIDRGGVSIRTDVESVDSDGDLLNDGAEADLDLDPTSRDTDGDGLTDGEEEDLIGTAPATADTDGDGFEDGYEHKHAEDQGLDPLDVDVKVKKLTYVVDFAKGAVVGDVAPGDSLAWIAGNLAASASSGVPVIGWITGTAADVRDLVASAIRRDWVGSGFNALGVIPYAGDAVAIPGKAAKFVARHPELAAAVAALVIGIKKLPEKVAVNTARRIYPGWDELEASGTSSKSLLRLAESRVNLGTLADALKRGNHVPGPEATFFANGTDGEKWLAKTLSVKGASLEEQVPAITSACVAVCNSQRRFFDVVVDGVAHESKVGYKTLTSELEKQIRSDAFAIREGMIAGAHWHFLPSGYTDKLGASRQVLELLDELRIPYTIHLPA